MKIQHVVYLIALEGEELPKFYIGSKSNAIFKGGKLYDRKGNEYFGSSRSKLYHRHLASRNSTTTLLSSHESYDLALESERKIHLAYKVNSNPAFFNLAIAASRSNYTDPAFATYKHSITDKVCRLRRDCKEVLSGEWVGVTRGTQFSAEERLSRGRSGNKNGFFGKSHSDKTKRSIGDKNRGRLLGNPKSPEQKRKMSEARKLWWQKKRESSYDTN